MVTKSSETKRIQKTHKSGSGFIALLALEFPGRWLWGLGKMSQNKENCFTLTFHSVSSAAFLWNWISGRVWRDFPARIGNLSLSRKEFCAVRVAVQNSRADVRSTLSSTLATSHRWLLCIWKVASLIGLGYSYKILTGNQRLSVKKKGMYWLYIIYWLCIKVIIFLINWIK